MAGRIRTIKPEILEDAKAARLSDCAWRLWVSGWLLADDHGRFRADPAMLLGAVFWGRPRSPAEVERALDELHRAGLIEVYAVGSQAYAHVPNWARHQRIDNAGKPRCPAPDEGVRGELPRFAASLGESPPDHDHDHDHDQEHEHEGSARGESPLAAGPPAAPANGQLRNGQAKKAKPSSPTPDEREVADRVIARLNERTGRHFRAPAHAVQIAKLLRHGYTERDLRLVIWGRCKRWVDNERMDEFLRPSTLFGGKFAEYLAEGEAEYAKRERVQDEADKPAQPPSEIAVALFGRSDR